MGWLVRRPISGKATRFPEIAARRQRSARVEQVPEINRRSDVVLIHPRRSSDELCSSRRSRPKMRATLISPVFFALCLRLIVAITDYE